MGPYISTLGVLVDGHTRLGAHPRQFNHQPGGVDDRAGVGGEQSGQVGGRVDLRPHRCLLEELPLTAGGHVPQPRHLMRFGGHAQHAGALPVDFHVVVLDVGRHPVQVGPAQRFKLVEFLRPARFPVLRAVGEAGIDEAAVAARCPPAQTLGLDQHHPGIGVTLGGV